jgi:agmatine deiminase
MTFTYRMPAEWEPHAATMLAWPHNKNDWPDKFAPIPWVYAEIIRYLSAHERVRLVVKNAKQQEQATGICERAGVDMGKIDFHIIPTNRIWLRDSGPILVKKTSSSHRGEAGRGADLAQASKTIPHPNPPPAGVEMAMLDWRFNAWAKYPDHKLDDKVPALLNEHLKLERIQPMHKGRRVVLEGGSIDVNGKGTLLTTEECLLSPIQERNPGFGREDYEQVFATYLGIKHIIWLENGIVGDDTHGHVDDLSRFTDANTVVTVVENDRNDPNHPLLNENLKRLKAARDQDGKQLNVVELPMPGTLTFEGQRLPASYANFLIANGVVLVPTFNDPADRTALSILAELFPNREVVGIHAVDLVWGLGTIHCMSQQEPR